MGPPPSAKLGLVEVQRGRRGIAVCWQQCSLKRCQSGLIVVVWACSRPRGCPTHGSRPWSSSKSCRLPSHCPRVLRCAMRCVYGRSSRVPILWRGWHRPRCPPCFLKTTCCYCASDIWQKCELNTSIFRGETKSRGVAVGWCARMSESHAANVKRHAALVIFCGAEALDDRLRHARGQTPDQRMTTLTQLKSPEECGAYSFALFS